MAKSTCKHCDEEIYVCPECKYDAASDLPDDSYKGWRHTITSSHYCRTEGVMTLTIAESKEASPPAVVVTLRDGTVRRYENARIILGSGNLFGEPATVMISRLATEDNPGGYIAAFQEFAHMEEVT